MMPTSVYALSYPTPRLTSITGKPKTGAPCILRRELYAKARTVPSMANGTRGLLVLVMPADEYLTLTGIAFVAPPPPGNPPVVAQNTLTLCGHQSIRPLEPLPSRGPSAAKLSNRWSRCQAAAYPLPNYPTVGAAYKPRPVRCQTIRPLEPLTSRCQSAAKLSDRWSR
jgi:hypothetical protein